MGRNKRYHSTKILKKGAKWKVRAQPLMSLKSSLQIYRKYSKICRQDPTSRCRKSGSLEVDVTNEDLDDDQIVAAVPWNMKRTKKKKSLKRLLVTRQLKMLSTLRLNTLSSIQTLHRWMSCALRSAGILRLDQD